MRDEKCVISSEMQMPPQRNGTARTPYAKVSVRKPVRETSWTIWRRRNTTMLRAVDNPNQEANVASCSSSLSRVKYWGSR